MLNILYVARPQGGPELKRRNKMSKYLITYENNTTELIRASSPKQAEERAVKGIVKFIKWLR